MPPVDRAPVITRREWRWVIAAGLLLLAISEMPYVLARLRSTPQASFSGYLLSVGDGITSVAKMQEGAHGAWLFHIAYTTEPHMGTLLFPYRLTLGRLAAFGPPLPEAHRLALWASALFLFVALYRFLALFLRAVRMRRLAWFLIAGGGGLSWLFLSFAGAGALNAVLPDVMIPEAFSSLALIYSMPHLVFARACLLIGLMWFIAALEQGSPRRALAAGLIWLLAGMVVPLDVVWAPLIMAAYLLALLIKRRRLPWRETGLAVIAGLCVLPFALYVLWIFQADPVLAGWSEQSIMPSPPPQYFLAAYAPFVLLALPALGWSTRTERRLWLPAIALTTFALAYAPIGFQRRLIEGFQIAVVTMATAGLARVGAAGLRRLPRVRRTLRLALVGLALPSNLLLLFAAVWVALAGTAPAFYPGGLVDAAAWLEQHAQGANVLSAGSTALALPALSYVRAYSGYDPETPRSQEKDAAVARFFQASTGDPQRRAILAAGHIQYVIVGPDERALAGGAPFDVDRAAYLQRVYVQGDWAVYRVAGAP